MQQREAPRRSAIGGTLSVAAAASLWGTWPLWLAGADISAAAMAALQLGAVSLLGVPAALLAARRRPALEPAGRSLWLLLGLYGLFDVGNSLLYFRALDTGSIAPAVLTHYLAPVLVALLAPLLLRERLARSTPPAVALAFAGTAALVLGAHGAATGEAGGRAVAAAAAFGAGSAVFYAANVLLAKRLTRAFTPLEVLAYHAVVSTLCLLPFVLHAPPGLRALGRPVIGALLCGFVAGLVYLRGLARIPAQRAGILSYLEPAVAVLVGWLALSQRPSAVAGLGGLAIVAGGALTLREARGAVLVKDGGPAAPMDAVGGSPAEPVESQ